MPLPQEETKRAEAKESLERMQTFNTKDLPREKELGTTLNFKGAVEPAKRLIDLYKRISVNVLVDFPQSVLQQLWTQANTDHTRLTDILQFEGGQTVDARDALIGKLDTAYQSCFTILYPFISYSISKTVDFQRLEADGRATIQSIQDNVKKITGELKEAQTEAGKILADIREAAAEHGVSQQAVYFKQAAEKHEDQAGKWLTGTIWLAVVMTLYAVASLFIHKIPFLKPDTTAVSIQLAISKALIFAVISYMLYMCVRNFLANRHNVVVNKHRQNALMTYTAIMDAAKDIEQKEVVLSQAASCIFAPQSTGYSRVEGSGAPSAKSVVELLTKPFTSDA